MNLKINRHLYPGIVRYHISYLCRPLQNALYSLHQKPPSYPPTSCMHNETVVKRINASAFKVWAQQQKKKKKRQTLFMCCSEENYNSDIVLTDDNIFLFIKKRMRAEGYLSQNGDEGEVGGAADKKGFRERRILYIYALRRGARTGVVECATGCQLEFFTMTGFRRVQATPKVQGTGTSDKGAATCIMYGWVELELEHRAQCYATRVTCFLFIAFLVCGLCWAMHSTPYTYMRLWPESCCVAFNSIQHPISYYIPIPLTSTRILYASTCRQDTMAIHFLWEHFNKYIMLW